MLVLSLFYCLTCLRGKHVESRKGAIVAAGWWVVMEARVRK